MKRKWLKRCTTIALTAAMVLSAFPGMKGTLETVQAAAIVKDVNLGTTGIGNPTSTGDVAWAGSRVYYGGRECMVLDKDGTITSGKSSVNGNMLLLTTASLSVDQVFDDDKSDWTADDCQIRNNLNSATLEESAGGFLKTLSGIEQGSLTALEISAANTSSNYNGYSNGTQTDKIFLLDVGDVNNETYGFGGSTARTNGSWWWLRSAGYSGVDAAIISLGGGIGSNGASVNNEYSARPAFNLNLNSVLFSSASSASKSSFTSVGDSNVAAGTWKLTLKDGNGGLAVTRTDAEGLTAGTTVNVNISDIGTPGTAYNTISAMLTDADGTVLCYGKAAEEFGSGTGNYSFAIPADVSGGKYFYVLAENVNGDTVTDYASDMKLVYTAPEPTPSTYTVTAGAAGTHQLSTDGSLTITCDGDLTELTGIYVDDNLVDATNYALQSGSTILTLNATYLNTLSAGTHRVRFQYNDGSAETTVVITESAGQNGTTPPINGTTGTTTPTTGDTTGTITSATTSSTQDATTASQKDDVPKTGDATQIVWLLMTVVISGAGVLYFGRKKKMGR